MSDDKILVYVDKIEIGTLSIENNEAVFSYYPKARIEDFVSLTMPVRAKSWVFPQLHPVFMMNIPEGYLLALIKKQFSKISKTDDFGLLKIMSGEIKGRVSYQMTETKAKKSLALNELLNSNNKNLFDELVQHFALSSGISGVQPKVIAQVENKITLQLDDYIVKAWGDDYPNLAENEYFCMQAIALAGIAVPQYSLSKNKQLFIMRRFDIQENGKYLGFEDMCVLQGKSTDDKYNSTYEKVAKSVDAFVSPQYKQASFAQFFKMLVMNTLLKNGDAHLKNFAVLYSNDSDIKLAPAFDVVTTVAYIKNDIPALSLAGSKKWWDRKSLIKFGIEHCHLNNKQSEDLYAQCVSAVVAVALELKAYIKVNSSFATVGKAMLSLWVKE